MLDHLRAKRVLQLRDLAERDGLSGACGLLERRVPEELLRSYCKSQDAEQGWLPWLVDEVSFWLPVAPSVRPSRGKFFFRLPGHSRSVFLTLNGGNRADNQLVVVFKGGEAASPCLPEILEALASHLHPRSKVSLLEHLVEAEHKIPYALTAVEARSEYSTALTIQAAYVPFGIFPRLPFPLAITRLSEDHRQWYEECARSVIRGTILDKVLSRIAPGIFVYTYAYPAIPARAADLSADVAPDLIRRPGMTTIQSIERLRELWIETLSLIIHAGYVPTGEIPARSGLCVDPNNVVLDGGMTDLDGCVSINLIEGQERVRRIIRVSLHHLLRAIQSVERACGIHAQSGNEQLRLLAQLMGQLRILQASHPAAQQLPPPSN